MPIYEFRCLNCQDLFEILVMATDAEMEMRCPKCSGEQIERVLSSAGYQMRSGGGASVASTQSRTCSSGSCTTWNLPGSD